MSISCSLACEHHIMLSALPFAVPVEFNYFQSSRIKNKRNTRTVVLGVCDATLLGKHNLFNFPLAQGLIKFRCVGSAQHTRLHLSRYLVLYRLFEVGHGLVGLGAHFCPWVDGLRCSKSVLENIFFRGQKLFSHFFY